MKSSCINPLHNPVGRATGMLIVLTGLLAPAHAGVVALDTWYEFSFTDLGTEARGCDPADPQGSFCFESSGTPTLFADAPPWTFTALSGANLIVTDAFLSGDQFEVFDFGVLLGQTSVPATDVDCGDDPEVCLQTAGMSNAQFNLAPGNHSITISYLAGDGFGGAGYFNVQAVPEPSTWMTLGFGIAGLLAFGAREPRRRTTYRRVLKSRAGKTSVGFTLVACATVALMSTGLITAQSDGSRFLGATSSQPITITADGAFIAVANPDNDSVTFFDVRNDRNRRLAEVPVQDEPNGVAMLPDGSKTYAANTLSGTVSVIEASLRNGAIRRPEVHIPVGVEPYSLVMSPNGTTLYVANARSNSVSVINTETDTVITTIQNVGLEPRGMAVTNDGDSDDTDEKLYVTQFLALPLPTKIDGSDDAKAGFVTVINTGSNNIAATVQINPLADTGFFAAGDALARIAPGANFTFPTGAYPNQLNAIAIKGNFAFLPNTGASPNGPVRFDVNTQSLLSVIDTVTETDAGKTINMHRAVADQPAPPKLFLTVPWTIAMEHGANVGYVASAASNVLVKVAFDPATGDVAVQHDPADATRVLQIPVGKNPRGLVINAADTRMYVMNYISRDVNVINLTPEKEVSMARITSSLQPVPGTLAEKIQIGKELYNTSVGEFDSVPLGGQTVKGRMSNNGWGSCSSCHPFGLSDNVVWIFPAGPRRTIPQHGDFDQTDADRLKMRVLNWSANRDEQEDFELNIRAVSGGQGIIVLPGTADQDPDVNDFTPLANGGRNQLTIRGIGGWDALKAYIQFGIRSPLSPVDANEPDVIAGRALFTAANCQSCHGGAQWTSSQVRFTPPPGAGIVTAGQVTSELRQVGTFDPAAFNEVRQNAAPPLGAAGFVPPSLLAIDAFPKTFFHNGSAGSLDEVMNNVTHRSAGTGGVDTLTNASDRAKVVKFLRSIDANTPVFP